MMPGWPSFMLPAPQHWQPTSSSICIRSSVPQHPTTTCLFLTQLANECRERRLMRSTNLEEIKAALWEQAYHPCTRVSWGLAQVMAVRRSRGHLQALLRGQKRWYEVSDVTIERPRLCPT